MANLKVLEPPVFLVWLCTPCLKMNLTLQHHGPACTQTRVCSPLPIYWGGGGMPSPPSPSQMYSCFLYLHNFHINLTDRVSSECLFFSYFHLPGGLVPCVVESALLTHTAHWQKGIYESAVLPLSSPIALQHTYPRSSYGNSPATFPPPLSIPPSGTQD